MQNLGHFGQAQVNNAGNNPQSGGFFDTIQASSSGGLFGNSTANQRNGQKNGVFASNNNNTNSINQNGSFANPFSGLETTKNSTFGGNFFGNNNNGANDDNNQPTQGLFMEN